MKQSQTSATMANCFKHILPSAKIIRDHRFKHHAYLIKRLKVNTTNSQVRPDIIILNPFMNQLSPVTFFYSVYIRTIIRLFWFPYEVLKMITEYLALFIVMDCRRFFGLFISLKDSNCNLKLWPGCNLRLISQT
jgi:hypothetical protein